MKHLDSPVPSARPRIRPTGSAAPALAVVIPALNEEATIADVVARVPRRIDGVRCVEVIVVDDGSTDRTAVFAMAAGADQVVSHPRNRGLVSSFNHGVSTAIARGADIVVNLDGDGQHDPAFIPLLLAPLVDGEADMVVGVRPLRDASQGTTARRIGNRLGSSWMRWATGADVADVTSGFRAYSRECLLRLNVVSDYTYTLETLIQATQRRFAIAQVEIPARPRQAGESRMTHSLTRYISRTGGQGARTMLHTNPLSIFGRAAAGTGLLAVFGFVWFVVGYQDGGMHLPSLLATVLLAVASVAFGICGLLADAVNSNRRLLEDALHRIKCMEAERHLAPDLGDVPVLRPPLSALPEAAAR